MTNAQQALRLLRELERLDQNAEEEESSSSGARVTAAAFLEALVECDYNLTSAILDVRNGD